VSGERPLVGPDPWCPRCGEHRLDHEPPGSRCRPWLVTFVTDTGPDVAALLLFALAVRQLVRWLGPIMWPTNISFAHVLVSVLVFVLILDAAHELVGLVIRFVHVLVCLVRECVRLVRVRRARGRMRS
jgi:hypothetical protein